MSISNLEQGSGTIASGAEAKPTKSAWRRTLVVLAVGAAAGSAATLAYSARIAKTSTLTTIMSPEEAQAIAKEIDDYMSKGPGLRAGAHSAAGPDVRRQDVADRLPGAAPQRALRAHQQSRAHGRRGVRRAVRPAARRHNDARADALSQGAILDEDVFEIEMERKAAGTKGEPNEDVDDRWNDDRDDDAGSPPDHV